MPRFTTIITKREKLCRDIDIVYEELDICILKLKHVPDHLSPGPAGFRCRLYTSISTNSASFSVLTKHVYQTSLIDTCAVDLRGEILAKLVYCHRGRCRAVLGIDIHGGQLIRHA